MHVLHLYVQVRAVTALLHRSTCRVKCRVCPSGFDHHHSPLHVQHRSHSSTTVLQVSSRHSWLHVVAYLLVQVQCRRLVFLRRPKRRQHITISSPTTCLHCTGSTPRRSQPPNTSSRRPSSQVSPDTRPSFARVCILTKRKKTVCIRNVE